MPVDIQQLAESVLSQVSVVEKTASAETTSEFQTEIGRALKEAAALIRNYEETRPNNDDLAALSNAKKIAHVDQPTTPVVVNGSEKGDYFRKLAQTLREEGSRNEELRAIKTAKIVNAAVALQHLGGK